ncbi:DNA primase [Chitinimonas sp. BJB300]|uniref:DNA primase n=1 Tax=Chitinimonas sp. BJB300 TaxID=1559339 RepID=UPI000C0CE27F|nr:DNA primase [Chitinimonas sp. BJB300]PHV10766.1 DNA primase [Chitinimonas sp. BJB300]TSJ84526.1 DNA primase [Chitinimonas sp. BJB300]
MARIPEDFIQDLLNRLDIVEVVERYLPLKKTGQNYSACCPFHKEKSPSFTVSATKQFYHCFGCGVHGSAIGFVMEYEGLGFQDTVEKLAESVSMQVPKAEGHIDDAPRRQQQSGLVDLNTRAMHYYRDQLKHSTRAVDYLKQRGLSGQIAARFGLGYAPDGWHPLAECFSDYATNLQLNEVGLVIDHGESGRRYDRFRDRILFPILNGKSQVIGFGGRIVDRGEPKYLNSPETPLFQKGLELYGLPQARPAIRAKNRVLVVEGYMDVVALAQLGVEYSVATLGTACTPEHVKKLLRLADQVVFSFDGDRAGRKAAWRALENCLAQASDGKTLSFLFLPAEHDPDSYIREFGQAAFEALIDQEAIGLAGFLCRELASQVDLQTEEGKAKFLFLAKPLVEQIKAPALGMLLRKKLAEMAGLDAVEVAQLLGGISPMAAHPPVVTAWQREGKPWQEGASNDRVGAGAWNARPGAWKDGGGKSRRGWRQDALRDENPTSFVEERHSNDLGFELLQLLVTAPKYALELPQNELPESEITPSMKAILRLVDFVGEQTHVPAIGHLLEALRDSPSYSLLARAFAKSRDVYRDGDEAILAQTWQETLARYLLLMEKPRAARRQAELAAKGLSNLSADERTEYSRLVMLGR